MNIEQDYIMRTIKEMVRAILKLLFGIDSDPSAVILEDTQEQQILEELYNMIDAGLINEAENMLYEIIEKEGKKDLEMALLFYAFLNDKPDVFLKEHHFSREEIKSGLEDVAARCGVSGLSEMFL